VAVDGERVAFDDSVQANVAAGDAFATRVRTMVDEIIRRRGLDAPPAVPDAHDQPVALDPPSRIDLASEQVASVVWCTGFTGDFAFLDPALLDPDGQPRHAAAALVKKVVVTFDKGAKCYATAARVSGADGSVVAGTPEEKIQSTALECGGAALGNGANQLNQADAKGAELKARYG
jgi:hypothetical protein